MVLPARLCPNVQSAMPQKCKTSILDVRLCAVGATVIVGPKWCGKTTTAKQKAKSVIEMQDPDLQEGYLKLASTKPSMLLEGANPRLKE